MGGGTLAAIRAIIDSEISPGPLGMEETNPLAEASQDTARAASLVDLIQQILIRVCNFNARYNKPEQRH
jgi:hypothetical protein